MKKFEYPNYLPVVFANEGNFEKIIKRIHEMVEMRKEAEKVKSRGFSLDYLFEHITMEKSLIYVRDYFLPFMFEHGYILKETEPIEGIDKFYNLEDTLKNYDIRMAGTPDEEIEPSTHYESLRYMEYMETAEFYPDCMKDFHDGKSICKRIDEDVEEVGAKNEVLSWCDAFIYIGDFFLYFCAAHGYTLQKIELPNRVFYDIDKTMKYWKQRNAERHRRFVESSI